ncbi:F-box/LRR-repeat protein 14-like [Oppia nitens]|uniref:F-box/LRR-repeat protein 14-like n=1 Tax=Oppia nitens TaxID=1686743 RepID=UPI0023DBC5E9|nr:F-box/LRR-repeat protein 14-like [Oppia nitens]
MSRRNKHQNYVIWHNRPTAHISCLYPEILALIFGYLDVRDKGSAAQVCRTWRDACYHKSVWKGVEAKIHLRQCEQRRCECPLNSHLHNALFESLVTRGIKKIQILSIRRSVREVVNGVPNLESLNLIGCYNLTDEWLTNALQRPVDTLTELNLSMCKPITDDSLDKISQFLRNLETLDLSGCSNITNAGLLHLSKSLKRLKYLNLRSCRNISDTGIGHISGSTQQTESIGAGILTLEFLGLQDCQKICDDSLRYIASKLHKLKSINLSFCSTITDYGLKHLSSMFSLREINLRSCDNITDTGLAHLCDGTARQLQVLDVSFSSDKIGDQGLVHISQKLIHLKSLSLNACSGVTDEGLIKIARTLTGLQVLNLGQCNKVTDKGLCAVGQHLVNLTHIDLYGCSRITTVGLEKIMQLPNLNLNLMLWQKHQQITSQSSNQC